MAQSLRDESDFSEVKGQYHVRRAVEVAAAGSHNLLIMIGPISRTLNVKKWVKSIVAACIAAPVVSF
jgi:predicted ATPase with chaperone activity